MFAYAVQLTHWETTPPGKVGKSHEQECRHTWEGRFMVITPNLQEATNLVKQLPVIIHPPPPTIASAIRISILSVSAQRTSDLMVMEPVKRYSIARSTSSLTSRIYRWGRSLWERQGSREWVHISNPKTVLFQPDVAQLVASKLVVGYGLEGKYYREKPWA